MTPTAPALLRANTVTSRWVLVAMWVALVMGWTHASAGAAELLMFESRGCPWCERWRQEVGVAYPNTAEGRRAPVRRLDLAQALESGVKLAMPVTISPTFVLAEKGREIGRITGYPGADFFWGLLAELIAKLDRGASRRDRLPDVDFAIAPLAAQPNAGHGRVPSEGGRPSAHRGLI